MKLGDFIKYCNNNFADCMDKELRIAVDGRGDHLACLPVLIESSFDAGFVTIPASGTEAAKYFGVTPNI